MSPLRAYRAVAVVLAALGPMSGARALDAISDEMAGGAAPSYVAVRCASLYAASSQWVGEDTLDAEARAQIEASIRKLMGIAAAMRAERNPDDAEVPAGILRDMTDIVALYRERFSDNYARGGQAFGQDPLLQQDFALCKAVAEQ